MAAQHFAEQQALAATDLASDAADLPAKLDRSRSSSGSVWPARSQQTQAILSAPGR